MSYVVISSRLFNRAQAKFSERSIVLITEFHWDWMLTRYTGTINSALWLGIEFYRVISAITSFLKALRRWIFMESNISCIRFDKEIREKGNIFILCQTHVFRKCSVLMYIYKQQVVFSWAIFVGFFFFRNTDSVDIDLEKYVK